MAEVVTKRLHISGLTPSITSSDIHRRLSAFGSVTSLDGFGQLDALGDPRPFAYATLEGKEKDIAKCMNVLSGSTWKGTKLRIGEAKPDYHQRIAYLNSLSPPPPRTPRSKRCQLAFPSTTLPLDTPLSRNDAAKAPGWVVLPSGRVVRPMRMRPLRPLEPTRAMGGWQGTRGKTGKKAKKKKVPPLWARRRLIDPTKWDSTYLTGAFLETARHPLCFFSSFWVCSPAHRASSLTKRNAMVNTVPSQNSSNIILEGQPPSQTTPTPTANFSDPRFGTDVNIDIRKETSAAAYAPQQRYSERRMNDGPGDHSAMVVDAGVGEVGEGEIEEVPRHASSREGDARINPVDKVSSNEEQREDIQMGDSHPTTAHLPATATGTTATSKADTASATGPTKMKLKDLFAPREEEPSFSLLGHLDLDLELEDDVLGCSSVPTTALPSTLVTTSSSEPFSSSNWNQEVKRLGREGSAVITPDSTRRLLFPLVESLPYSNSGARISISKQVRTHARSDTWSVVFPRSQVNVGTPQDQSNPPPLSGTGRKFERSPDTTEQFIREAWERDKSEVTSAWKKAWKEAKGRKRGCAAADGMDV
ncbi:hypothetical protein F5J12DRAFT_966560 [Pisolithus orientalis]|uniref:uncharacterized protein n=1 Tax=Pisolithus orientalis TaxID=936130 RepID=UPI002225AD98|nr:uncharacterized protein F5J12DRAFT_966560 [Pisolithus orientalis]KAI5990532.1 hypothetical protein F5J12DRAFT_966560 [Pisolithus orientalis]